MRQSQPSVLYYKVEQPCAYQHCQSPFYIFHSYQPSFHLNTSCLDEGLPDIPSAFQKNFAKKQKAPITNGAFFYTFIFLWHILKVPGFLRLFLLMPSAGCMVWARKLDYLTAILFQQLMAQLSPGRQTPAFKVLAPFPEAP